MQKLLQRLCSALLGCCPGQALCGTQPEGAAPRRGTTRAHDFHLNLIFKYHPLPRVALIEVSA